MSAVDHLDDGTVLIREAGRTGYASVTLRVGGRFDDDAELPVALSVGDSSLWAYLSVEQARVLAAHLSEVLA